jgi:hypothetical protein
MTTNNPPTAPWHGASDEPPDRPAPLKPHSQLAWSDAVGAECSDPNIVKWIIYLEYYREKDQQRLAALESQNAALTQRMNAMSTTVDQLQTDFDKYKTDVSGALGALTASVAALTAELANAPITPAVQAKLDALDSDITAADAVVNPPVPVATPAKKK